VIDVFDEGFDFTLHFAFILDEDLGQLLQVAGYGFAFGVVGEELREAVLLRPEQRGDFGNGLNGAAPQASLRSPARC